MTEHIVGEMCRGRLVLSVKVGGQACPKHALAIVESKERRQGWWARSAEYVLQSMEVDKQDKNLQA